LHFMRHPAHLRRADFPWNDQHWYANVRLDSVTMLGYGVDFFDPATWQVRQLILVFKQHIY
jgi:hypothetical protein